MVPSVDTVMSISVKALCAQMRHALRRRSRHDKQHMHRLDSVVIRQGPPSASGSRRTTTGIGCPRCCSSATGGLRRSPKARMEKAGDSIEADHLSTSADGACDVPAAAVGKPVRCNQTGRVVRDCKGIALASDAVQAAGVALHRIPRAC